MDFVTELSLSVNLKGDSYNVVLVIVDRLTKTIHYELVKVTIDILGLAEMIINMVIRYHGVPESIVIDQGSLFTLKLWFLLCYFLDIKTKLSIAFYPQTNSRSKRQNSMMEAYVRAFVNWK